MRRWKQLDHRADFRCWWISSRATPQRCWAEWLIRAPAKRFVDLEGARDLIDMIDALREKTQGNLAADDL